MGEPRKSPFSPYALLPDDFQEAIKRVGEKAKFPIGSKKEFVAQMGGEKTVFLFRDQKLPLAELIAFMPSSLFPLYSLENLAEKASELYFQRQERPTRPILAEELKLRIDKIFSNESKAIDEILKLIWRVKPENLDR